MIYAESNGVSRLFRCFLIGAVLALAEAGLRAQPSAPASQLLTPAEQQWLQQHPGIRLAPTPNYQPVEFFDATGNYAGMTADYFRIIEQKLNYKFQIVRPTPEQWAELDPKLRGADVITASAATPTREQYWAYTSPYLELPTYVITRDQAEDGLTLNQLAGQRVAVVGGWAVEEYLKATHTNLIIVPVADAPSGLRKVSFGLVDAFVSELPVATAWMETEGISNLKATAEAGYTYKLSISVRKDWPELSVILNKALAAVTPEQRRQIFERWVKLKTPTERQMEKTRQRLRWAAAGLVGLLVLMLLWNRLLAWRVRARTLELQLSEDKFAKAFRASPDGLAISEVETGRFVEVNDGYCLLYGFKREEMIGRTSVEMGIWQDPKDRDRVARKLLEAGGVRNLELRMRTRAGGLRIIILNGETIKVGGKLCFVSVLHDITDRLAAEQALRTSEETQRRVLEMIAGGQPMGKTLDSFLRMIESQVEDMICSILLLDPDGVHIRHGAAPSLPAEFIQAVDGQPIGPCAGSCGTAAYRKEPVFVADIATDPLWADYKGIALPHGLRACWSTPIFDEQRRVLGTFAVYRRQTGMPEERHQKLISIVTHTAAICVSRHRAESEREQSIVREMDARIQYTLRLIAAQEAERKRIAAELHDSMGQNLLLIRNLAEMSLRADEPAKVREHVGNISELAIQCIAEARRISRDLHPHQLDHLGVKRALEAMIEQTTQASHIQFATKIEPVDDLFTGDAAMNLYRVVQESLNNVLKHSGAGKVIIRLERDIHEVLLHIEDDGAGFVVDGVGEKEGLGLKNMSERVRMLGGKLNLSSAPGKGTCIEVAIPIINQAGSVC
jgi:PAS domain S-box-containing protein